MIPNRITIHCSATLNGVKCPAPVIEQWHKSRGFSEIGYHLVIQPDGEAEKGRPLNKQGAHVEGDNENNIGICLIGTDKFKIKQFEVLRYQLDSIIMVYNIKPWEIWAHNQFQSAIAQKKTCPNMSINQILAWYIGNNHDAIEKNILR
jgi:hypothetical protein